MEFKCGHLIVFTVMYLFVIVILNAGAFWVSSTINHYLTPAIEI